MKSERERFDAKWEPVPESGCWIWTAAMCHRGYGRFNLKNKSGYLAHRWAYETFRGPIPNGLILDHLCRVRCCVNPLHLEAVTIRINNLRGIGFAAQNVAKTHCIKGHLLAGDNLWVDKNGGRRCKVCVRLSKRLESRVRSGWPENKLFIPPLPKNKRMVQP